MQSLRVCYLIYIHEICLKFNFDQNLVLTPSQIKQIIIIPSSQNKGTALVYALVQYNRGELVSIDLVQLCKRFEIELVAKISIRWIFVHYFCICTRCITNRFSIVVVGCNISNKIINN